MGLLSKWRARAVTCDHYRVACFRPNIAAERDRTRQGTSRAASHSLYASASATVNAISCSGAEQRDRQLCRIEDQFEAALIAGVVKAEPIGLALLSGLVPQLRVHIDRRIHVELARHAGIQVGVHEQVGAHQRTLELCRYG